MYLDFKQLYVWLFGHVVGRCSTQRYLLWIVVVAFLARVAFRSYLGADDFWTNGYGFFFELAQSIAAGNGILNRDGIATAFRVPLYPIFLAAVTFGHKEFLPVLFAQSLIGAGTVWCTAQIARQMFGDRVAVIAACLAAVYPYYIVHDTALQETSLYTFLTALSVFLLIRTHQSGSRLMSISAGVVLGAAVLTRANLAPFAIVAPISLLPTIRTAIVPMRRRLLICLLCMGAFAATVSPWLVRTYWLTGSFTLSTESGFFLWLGNNRYTFSHYPRESIDRSQAVALRALNPQQRNEMGSLGSNEAAVDRWFLKEGLDYIRENPWQALVKGATKIAAAFCVLPSPRRSFWPNLVYFLSYTPVMILGIYGMWSTRRQWPEHVIIYAVFVTFAVVTAIFFGHTSYRVYLDIYWIIFAAALLARQYSRYRSAVPRWDG